MTLSHIIQDILDTHHAFLKRELPRLDGVLKALAREHDEVLSLSVTFRSLRGALEDHMKQEEEMLFPTLRLMSDPDSHIQALGVAGPIAKMEDDHHDTKETLNLLTQQMGVLDGKENLFPRDVKEAIQNLQADLREHVRKEDEELFAAARKIFNADT